MRKRGSKPFPTVKRRKSTSKKVVKKVMPAVRQIINSNEVICSHCHQPSGWDNSLLRFMTEGKVLNCRHCGKVCVRFVGKPVRSDDPDEFESSIAPPTQKIRPDKIIEKVILSDTIDTNEAMLKSHLPTTKVRGIPLLGFLEVKDAAGLGDTGNG